MPIALKANPDGTSGAVQISSTDILTVSTTGLGVGKVPNASLDYRETVSVISTGTTAVASRHYVLTANLTLTLPSAPTVGDWVKLSNRSGVTTAVVARNGQNIMGLAENFTIDIQNFVCTFVFSGASQGWVII
jgi:hypothetical protein